MIIDSIKKALGTPLRDTQDLIRYEAKIGGQLFGPIPNKHHREFFCLDEHTWVWHEEWPDERGRRQSLTTRYDIRPNGVFKTKGNNPYSAIDQEELLNLYQASKLYSKKIIPILQSLANKTSQ
jgi:hypothetical protein